MSEHTLDDLRIMLESAKKSARVLACLDEAKRKHTLLTMADAIVERSADICAANAQDIKSAQNLPTSMQKRLLLNEQKILALADSIRDIARLPNVIGQVKKSWQNKAGLHIEQVSVPIGVIGVIYESRPNVTSDVASLCFKSGNVAILKGGKEAYRTNMAIFDAMQSALEMCHLPKDCICMIKDTSREGILAFVKMDKYVDLLIPRGGEGLISFVKEHSRIPIVKHDKGVCHTYIHKSADMQMAINIVLNAKISYPAACNACECVLLDKDIESSVFASLVASLHSNDVRIMFENDMYLRDFGIDGDGLADFTKEWGDKIINLKVVANMDEALAHIAHFGSSHSESIIAKDQDAKKRFLLEVDAACVYVNASTRFSDGGEFGFGAEVGISTSKLHARGPMGLESLCSYKYCIKGTGQVR